MFCWTATFTWTPIEVANRCHRHPVEANLVSNPRDYRASKLWLFIVFSLCFAIVAGSFLLDGLIAEFMASARTPGLNTAVKTMTKFGDVSVLALVVACVYAVGGKDLGRRAGILAALALVTTGLCVLVLKLLTARGGDGEFHFFWNWYPRAMMFPSGHTATVCAEPLSIGV